MSGAYRQDLNWLVSDFTARVPDVAHAAVISADGVPLSLSDEIPPYFAEQLAAITSGLASLMQGAARIFEAGLPTQGLVEMEGGLMIIKAISDGSSLCVLAAPDCDTEMVAYEMSVLVEAAGEVLSPALRGASPGGAAPSGTGGRRPPTSPLRGAAAKTAAPPARWLRLNDGAFCRKAAHRPGRLSPPGLALLREQVHRVVVRVLPREAARVVGLKRRQVSLRPVRDAQ